MQICKALLCATACALALAGCSNPYALKTSDIRYDRPQTEGVIRFADPKIYRREALINERTVVGNRYNPQNASEVDTEAYAERTGV